MTFTINTFGVKSTAVFLTLKNLQTKRNIKEGLKKAALFMQGEVKLSIAGHKAEPTSVDTGRFLNSVDFVVGEDDALVFSNIPYAQHLEFGTRRITPRRHFQNSKNRNKQEIKNILQKKII